MGIIQYPHKLTATIVSGTTQDENGNWVPGTPTTRQMDCRAEPNDKGRLLQLADGSQILYAWVVYMPKGTTSVPDGTQVEVFWGSELIGRGTVKRFSQGQLNSRLWL